MSGFSLIEVLISLALVSLTLAFAIPLMTDVTEKLSGSVTLRSAIVLAEGHLAEPGRTIGLTDGEDRGKFDNLSWVRAQRRMPELEPSGPEQAAVYRITVTVSWREHGRTRSLSLETLRLGGAA